MDKTVSLSKPINIGTLLRQAGYHPLNDAWVRQLSNAYYPRFHLYLSADPDQLKLSLHLDQKQSTIKLAGLKRHAGDYQSPVVTEELNRILRWVTYLQQI
jgi:hypothetical protein